MKGILSKLIKKEIHLNSRKYKKLNKSINQQIKNYFYSILSLYNQYLHFFVKFKYSWILWILALSVFS